MKATGVGCRVMGLVSTNTARVATEPTSLDQEVAITRSRKGDSPRGRRYPRALATAAVALSTSAFGGLSFGMEVEVPPPSVTGLASYECHVPYVSMDPPCAQDDRRPEISGAPHYVYPGDVLNELFAIASLIPIPGADLSYAQDPYGFARVRLVGAVAIMLRNRFLCPRAERKMGFMSSPAALSILTNRTCARNQAD